MKKLKILYFTQFYYPENIAASFRATEHSKVWKKDGNEVTIFTTYPNYPTGKILNGYKNKLLSIEKIDEVKVIRSKIIAKSNKSFFSRLQNALSYFFFGIFNIIFNLKKIGKDFDIILGTSGSIFNGILAWIFSVLHNVPFIFEIRDITYIQMLAVKQKNSIFIKSMKKLELFLCKKSKKVIVVTEGFKEVLISEGIEKKKIFVITNGVDVSRKVKLEKLEKLVISYFGTLGISQNISQIIGYIDFLKNSIEKLECLIIGEGAEKERIKENIKAKKYIKILDGMPLNKLEKYYKITLLSIVTLKNSENFKYTIPSKLFQIMGRGIAVLYIGPEGEASNIIKKYNCGISLTQDIYKNIKILEEFFSEANWKEKLVVMGENGRKAIIERYSREKLAKEYITILNK
jgi:glycosyltransferase involved in cell wall biosynthesis